MGFVFHVKIILNNHSILYLYSMNYSMLINILEIVLLAGIFIFILRFIFMNYTSRVRKPAAWIHDLKHGMITRHLRQAEKKYADRFRFYNIWLQIRRLEKERIPGDFAELGVYKGQTAKVIHLCAPERKLHLFDTFEGFPAGDLKQEKGKAAGYTTQHFADTGIGKVKQLLGESDNIIYHQGYFPDSTKGLENAIFAFVSLDADLHKPTAAGLKFFYERLSAGGVMLIHDYNEDWPGLMQAVDDFCRISAEYAIPVPDADSTVMIIRNKS